MRGQDIIHRDIKPQNLLLSPDPVSESNPPLLQVADFGFARFLPQASMAETLCGSPLYMAPEILRYEKYDAKADLWSTGAVLYEMCCGRPPFRAQNHVELLKKIERNQDKITFPDEQPTDDPKLQYARLNPVAPDLKDLLRKLLKKNPVERMSFVDFFADVAKVTSDQSGTKSELPSPPLKQQPATLSPTNTTPSPKLRPFPSPPSSSKASPPSFPPKYIVGPSSSQRQQASAEPSGSSASPPSRSRTPHAQASQQPSTAAVTVRDYALRQTPSSTSKPVSKPAIFSTKGKDASSSQSGDSLLTREYVMVEKGPVEINALADGAPLPFSVRGPFC